MKIAMGGPLLSAGVLFPLAAASLVQPVKTENGSLVGVPSADGSVVAY
jgi:hypothetical protein